MAETNPLQTSQDDRAAYGTTSSGPLRQVQKKRAGGSTKCLVISSACVTIALVGALYFYPQKIVKYEHVHSHVHKAASAVSKIFVAGGHKLAATRGVDLNDLPEDMQAAIDPSVDPCQDFYQFSCGEWIANKKIPTWQSSWAKQWDGVTTDVEHKTVEALKKDNGPGGNYFKSCMDTDTIQKLGSAPLQPWLKMVDMVHDHPSMMQAVARFGIADMNLFFSWWVDADSVDSSINSFFVAQGGITMPDQTYYTKSTAAMAKHRQAYTTMIINIMKLAGRSDSQARQDAANVMKFETALARAMTPPAEERDAHGVRVSVDELQSTVPSLDWPGFFTMLGIPHVGTKKGGYLVMKNKAFLVKLNGILRTIGLETIKSYMSWQVAYAYAPYLSFPFEDELVRYNKDLYGISQLPPRWRKCFFSTVESMDMIASKIFVDAWFPESSRESAIEMIHEIRDRFNATLQTKSWMDEETRRKAVYKLEHMFLEVGHPSKWPESTYETFETFGGIHSNLFFDNCVATNAYDVKKALSRLGKPVNRFRWGSSSATDVNSFYSRKVNGIFIPAGILQPPFFSSKQSPARNYGSVGGICGHEMTHGFDDIGREYDADGNRNGWWTPQVVANFKDRAKCIKDLFSGYEVDGRHVNGELTLGEAIADSGGMKFSWEAFLKKYTPTPQEKQEYFIAMGQTWCQKDKEVAARANLLTDQHPPSKYRVIGTLSQFAPFAETFKCPVGSPMNPEKRCHLW